MVNIPLFQVTAWVDEHAHSATNDLAGSICSPLRIRDLIALSKDPEATKKCLDFESIDLDYNSPMHGGHKLRDNIAKLYSTHTHSNTVANDDGKITREHILTTNAGIDANHIVLAALLGPTDHVICHYPTYQQLYEVPLFQGAEVSLWKSDPADNWKLDINVLKSRLRDNTKMIILNVPQNPTGAIIPQSQLDAIIEIARERNIIVFCDEAFQPLFHGISPSDTEFPKSIVSSGYSRTIATGTMSKAFSLPGIRAGWIVSRNPEILSACFQMRYYTTTTVSQLNEAVAAEALDERCISAILERNMRNCTDNIQAWQEFVDVHAWACSWVRPVGGTTAMIQFQRDGKPVDDVEFCFMVLKRADVCLIPGRRCFGDGIHFEGYVRIGVGLDPGKVKAGLLALAKFMKEDFGNVPLSP